MVCGLVRLTTNLLNGDAATSTPKRSAPDVVMALCVATTLTVSALYKTMLAVATPLLNEILVAVPKLVPPTVGTVTGLEELAAPVNVTDLVPV
ncbi:hypothetical protein AQBE111736_13725 [Aquirufa beregesia]